MKVLKYLLVSIAMTFSLNSLAWAVPAPTLFVYNDSAKECGTYRDGDEYVRYELPAAWQTYDYNKSTAKTTQQYCDELGYVNIGEVVSYLNLPAITLMQRSTDSADSTEDNFNNSLLIIILATIALLVAGLVFAVKKFRVKPNNT